MLLSQDFNSDNLESTEKWAKKLIQNLGPNTTIGFMGDLGSGKTTLIQGILKGFNYQGLVTSPSYTLVNEYETTPPIIHMDLYRLSIDADWEEIGLDYYLNQNSICLIEWPERLPNHIRLNYTLKIEKRTEHSRFFCLTKHES